MRPFCEAVDGGKKAFDSGWLAFEFFFKVLDKSFGGGGLPLANIVGVVVILEELVKEFKVAGHILNGSFFLHAVDLALQVQRDPAVEVGRELLEKVLVLTV